VIYDILEHIEEDKYDEIGIDEAWYTTRIKMRKEYYRVKKNVAEQLSKMFLKCATDHVWMKRYNMCVDYYYRYVYDTGVKLGYNEFFGKMKKREWNEMSCACIMIEGDNVELLRYAYDNGSPINAAMYVLVAGSGHIKCLKYMHEKGYEMGDFVCEGAASRGQLECLKYAHENGCPWNEDVCKYAARRGKLECLRYAHENGCPWDYEVCNEASCNGRYECLKYAHENGCPWENDNPKICEEYAGNCVYSHYRDEHENSDYWSEERKSKWEKKLETSKKCLEYIEECISGEHDKKS
jgi:hypothetical protein